VAAGDLADYAWTTHLSASRVTSARGTATERLQAVKIEGRAPLGALDDVVDLEGAPAATRVVPPAGAPEKPGGSPPIPPVAACPE
jgi:hypothetical protein